MILERNARLEDLGLRFSQLESKLKDSPEKEAISMWCSSSTRWTGARRAATN